MTGRTPRWTTADIPDQHGRSAIVTGTGGIGLQCALALARAGAETILAGRDPAKGAAAVRTITRASPGARIGFEMLDLASLASVEAFAGRLGGRRDSLDLLVNNAGVMAPLQRRTTADGFELQLGTNYLGHYALTARLLPLLRAGNAPRVVSVSSIAHRRGAMRFDDLQNERDYRPGTAYAQSKLAMLLFALELQRRSVAAGWGVASIGAHPGVARTALIANGPGRIADLVSRPLMAVIGQSAAAGALPLLYAATAPGAIGGHYYGPARFSEFKGPPREAEIRPQGLDAAAAARLWSLSEELTGVRFAA